MPGKIDSPRRSRKDPEGGYRYFKIEELFESFNGDVDIKKIHINGKGNNVISAGESNNGVVGKTDIPAKVFNANTITIDMFGNAYYQFFPYKMVTHARVFSLSPVGIMRMNEKIGLYIVVTFQYFKRLFSYGNMCSWEKIRRMTIPLPMTKTDAIDFEFIEEQVNEFEKERLNEVEKGRSRELELYLREAGFENCIMSKGEELALCCMHKRKMKEFAIGDLFNIHKGKRLTKANMIPGNINFIGATAINNGITGRISNNTHLHPSNTITVTYNGSVGEAFYQTAQFWASDDVNVLYPKEPINENLALYFLALLRKKGKGYTYSFKWTKEKMKGDTVGLPYTESDGNLVIDYAFIDTYINAIKKQCINQLENEFKREHAAYEHVVLSTN